MCEAIQQSHIMYMHTHHTLNMISSISRCIRYTHFYHMQKKKNMNMYSDYRNKFQLKYVFALFEIDFHHHANYAMVLFFSRRLNTSRSSRGYCGQRPNFFFLPTIWNSLYLLCWKSISVHVMSVRHIMLCSLQSFLFFFFVSNKKWIHKLHWHFFLLHHQRVFLPIMKCSEKNKRKAKNISAFLLLWCQKKKEPCIEFSWLEKNV